ncbi:MAG: chemotaxis protein [Rhodospirillaceae bacterium]|nr:MAG: chemotaxis protein [Rhodospirillaceae bacterium]
MSDPNEIASILNAMMNGDFSQLPIDDDPLSHAICELGKILSDDSKLALDRTVRFSMNASDAMTSVAQMSSNLMETDNRTQTMAAAVEELTASIGQITEASNAATELAASSNAAATQGVESVDTIVRHMDSITDVVENVSERTQTLTDAANQIAGILETIDAIAKQTNLLALNATIEAARAGEHGKGFAVVAGEVKALANQTSGATEDIRARIGVLTREIETFLKSVSTALKEVDNGKKAVVITREGIHGINDDVSVVSARMGEISSMLSEQTKAVAEIGSGISNVADLSSRNRNRADQAITAVGATESLIEEQFAKLEEIEIPNYVLHRAKSDHFIWKKKLAEMFVGLNNLQASELADHHQCRLGKWYDQITDPAYVNDPDFKSLVEPHARVHQFGKEAAQAYSSGNPEEADRLFAELEKASVEVVAGLDKLIAKNS